MFTKLITTNSVLFLVFLSVLLFSCSSNRPEYGIRVDTKNINLGTVYLDSAIRKVTVGYVNTGKKDLVITNILSDCECTTVQFSKNPVSSGDKSSFQITVDLHRFFPQQIEKRVAVYSNATNSPIMIDIKGDVKYKK